MLPVNIFIFVTFLQFSTLQVGSTKGNAPILEWRALIGSFASSDSGSESNPLPKGHSTQGLASSSTSEAVPRTIRETHHEISVRDHFVNHKENQLAESSEKLKGREKYLKLKCDPARLKKERERNKTRYLEIKAFETEMLEKLPEDKRKAYIKQRQQNRTMASRYYRQKQFERIQNLPMKERLEEIERQRILKHQQYKRHRAKKSQAEQKEE